MATASRDPFITLQLFTNLHRNRPEWGPNITIYITTKNYNIAQAISSIAARLLNVARDSGQKPLSSVSGLAGCYTIRVCA